MERNMDTPAGGASPKDILGAAIKAVPAVKYALGVAGIAAAAAIIVLFFKSLKVAFLAIVIMLVLMVILVVFVRLTRSAAETFHGPIVFLIWAFVLLAIFTPMAFFTSVFLKWPLNLSGWIVSPDGQREETPVPPAVAALVDIELSASELVVPGDNRPWLHVKAVITNNGKRTTTVIPLGKGPAVEAVSAGSDAVMTSKLIAVAPNEDFAHGCVIQPNAKCYAEFTQPVPKPGLYRVALRLTLPEDEADRLRQERGLTPDTIFMWVRDVHVTVVRGR